jgi:hypothetical protein
MRCRIGVRDEVFSWWFAVGFGVGLQDSQTEHGHDGAFDAPVELHVPEEEDGEHREDPVC